MDQSAKYQPGICNIGAKEIMVRRKFLKFFLLLTAILSVGGIFSAGSLLIWLGLVCTSFSAIVLWMEIRYHFCIIFGFFSLHNFKELGHLDEVKDPAFQKKDRKRVLEIVVFSLMIALIYATIIHVTATGM